MIDIDRFKAVGKELSDATNAINERIESLEKQLQDAALGITASVKMEAGELGYGKINGEWRLYWETDSVLSPLRDSPRRIRLAALKHFDALTDQILKNAVEINKKMRTELGLESPVRIPGRES